MGKSAPPPPDYTGAAEKQSQASMDIAKYTTGANRPDIYLPGGSSITWDRPGSTGGSASSGPSTAVAPDGGWNRDGAVAAPTNPYNQWSNPMEYASWNMGHAIKSNYDATQGAAPPSPGDDGNWAMHVNLSPAEQAALEAQQRIGAARSGMAEGLLGQLNDIYKTPMDWSSLPALGTGEDARNRAEQAIYDRASSRLDPMWSQREQAMRTQLMNQGLDPSSQAFQADYGNFSRGRNDAYQQAMDQAIIGGGQEASRQYGLDLNRRQQALAEMLQQRGQPLNELNALLSGQQVSMPQAPSFMGASQGQSPNYLGAAQMGGQYGLDSVASQNQFYGDLFGGLGGLGGGLLSYFGKK